MEPNEPTKEERIRRSLDEVLTLLRQEKNKAANVEKSRAIAVAITQLEIASMCTIRSFFADEPYSPMQILKKA